MRIEHIAAFWPFQHPKGTSFHLTEVGLSQDEGFEEAHVQLAKVRGKHQEPHLSGKEQL